MTPIGIPLLHGSNWRTALFGHCPSLFSLAATAALMVAAVLAWCACALAWHEAQRVAAIADSSPKGVATGSHSGLVRANSPRAIGPSEDFRSVQAIALVRRLNYPWPTVLDDLERLTPKGINIIELALDSRSQQARLRVSASHMRDVVDWFDRMKEARAWSGLRVIEYSPVQSEPRGRVLIVLQAELTSVEQAGREGEAKR